MTRTRKLLTILEKNDLIVKNIGRKGSTLTDKGSSLCESIFSYLKIVNPFVSVDLGNIVLGKFNSVTLLPRKLLTKEINAIEIRDTSLKCGALGASIFETFQLKERKITIKFFNEEDFNEEGKSPELPKYYFNPLFDSKKVNAFKVSLIASVQSMWDVIESELG